MEALRNFLMAARTDKPTRCQWTTEGEAFRHFATYEGRTQSQRHIKPLHWYVACRLVVEGGFRPSEIQPRPPLEIRRTNPRKLTLVTESADGSEATILGGLKTKSVDVVVSKPGIGPVLAVSCKGITGAFRNLTNRMEEMIGECTNLHITYPALVLGYFFLVRGNPETAPGANLVGDLGPNDIAMSASGGPNPAIARYHAALSKISGRRGIRDEVSAYEAATLVVVDPNEDNAGAIIPTEFPASESELGIEEFFQTLYQRYDERFVHAAPELNPITRRLIWSSVPDAPGSDGGRELGYTARLDHVPPASKFA